MKISQNILKFCKRYVKTKNARVRISEQKRIEKVCLWRMFFTLKSSLKRTLEVDMNYISVKDAAEKWGVTARRVQILCSEEKIKV